MRQPVHARGKGLEKAWGESRMKNTHTPKNKKHQRKHAQNDFRFIKSCVESSTKVNILMVTCDSYPKHFAKQEGKLISSFVLKKTFLS